MEMSQTSFRKHAINIAFIFALFALMFWRVFFLGETLIDVAALNNQLPWGYYAGETNYPYNRRDLTDTYITRDYFVVQAYREGQFPLWNPYTMAGHPIYADGVTRTLSPFLLFYTFLDVPLGYSVARIAEMMLAALFMYIFVVNIGIKPQGALMGTLVFAFSSHSMLHLTGLGWWGGLMWLPLIMLFVDRAIVRRSYKNAIIAGIFLAVQFFCGWMQNQIYYVSAIALYYLFFAFALRKQRPVWQPLAMMAVTIAVGFALAATQWLPVMELLRYSNRKIVPTEIGYVYLPPWYLITLIFPNLFGEADDTRMLTLFTGLNVSRDHILYIGIAALVPLGFLLHWLWRTRKGRSSSDNKDEALDRSDDTSSNLIEDLFRLRIQFFILLALITFFVMMAAPLYVHATRFIPVLQVIRVIVRVWVLLIFALAALTAFGTDLLLKFDNQLSDSFTRWAKRFFIASLALVAGGIVVSYIAELSGFAVDIEGRGKMAFLRRAAAALSEQFTPPNADIIVPLALMLIIFLLIKFFKDAKLSRNQFFAALIILLIIDLFRHDTQFNQSFNRSRVFPRTEITDLLTSLSPGRVLIVPSDMDSNRRAEEIAGKEKIIAPPNTLLPYRIPTVAGKNQQFPRWYRDYAALIQKQPFLSHVVFDETSSRFFDLLSVRYLLTHTSRPAPEGYEFIASAEGVSVYENKHALPHAFLTSKVIGVADQREALRVLADESFDPRSCVVVESKADSRGQFETSDLKSQISDGSIGNAEIIENSINRVAIKTISDRETMLVLSDNYYPGWQATVDNEPSTVYKANCTMRAVKLAPGEHVVSFEFAPATLTAAIYVSIASLLIVAAALLAAVFRERQPRYTEK
jgi:hypothetical protein